MAKGRKRKDSGGENVEAYRHETGKRKIVVSVRLASYDSSNPKPKRYDYDPHLDPQLIWSGEKSIPHLKSRKYHFIYTRVNYGV